MPTFSVSSVDPVRVSFASKIQKHKTTLIHTTIKIRKCQGKCRDAAGFSNPGGLAVMWWA